MTRTSRTGLAAGVLLLAATLAACGASDPTASRKVTPSATSSATPTATASPSPSPSPSRRLAGRTRVDKLLVVVVENHSRDQMRASMPKTFALAEQYGYATSYFGLTHPSLPNYLAIASGDLHGVTDDHPPADHPLDGATVFGRAVSASRTARVYADAMTAPCQPVNGGRYAVRHNPWTYFPAEAAACRSDDVPEAAFAQDAAAGTLPNAGLLVPDTCNDAHSCPLAVADQWISSRLEAAMAGPDWASGRLAIVVTADEDDKHHDNRVLTMVFHAAARGRVVTEHLDHYALYGLYEQVLGLTHQGTHPQGDLAAAFGLPVGR